jgi:hypothetical protein
MESSKEHEPIPGVDEDAAEKIRANDVKIAELSHLNDGETGFNPTAAEMTEVFEGIKAGIKKRGQKGGSHEIQKK